MHGLINRAIQAFTRDTYGNDTWLRVTAEAGLGYSEFEAMLSYEDDITRAVTQSLGEVLGRPSGDVLEDLGTYLVSHPSVEALRRLLRFGGDNYVEFLHSLDELPDRVRMAVCDLSLPSLDLREYAAGRYSLSCGPGLPGYSRVMTGILRAMADDYGALAMLECKGGGDDHDVIEITLVENAFFEGRSFELGVRDG